MAEPDSSELETTTKPHVVYRCKKCRRIVASEENIVFHQHGKGELSFKWKKRSGNLRESENQPVDCTSLFVEPMKWMQAGTCTFPSYIFCCHRIIPHANSIWILFEFISTRRSCGGETSLYGLQCSFGLLQLGRYAVQLWSLG